MPTNETLSLLARFAPYWLTMVGLMALSAFFSASEAALFYLQPAQRRRFAVGTRPQRAAADLLTRPDELLTAVLFANLVVNLFYFGVTSLVTIKLDAQGHNALAAGVGIFSLFALILLSEMIPKSLAVIRTELVAALVAPPMTLYVGVTRRLLPLWQAARDLSQRVIFPNLRPEPYLSVNDLERALEASTTDAELRQHEHTVLESIVALSDTRAEELMRLRSPLRLIRTPVAWRDLGGTAPPSGYLFIIESDSDEIARAVPLTELSQVPRQHLETLAEEVIYVPWCAQAAAVLNQLQRRDLDVAVVVNEFGETIGALTYADLLETMFSESPSRSRRLLDQRPIAEVEPGVWHVSGLTSLRRLTRYFGIPRPESRSSTVAGLIQELLERFPQEGDECDWEGFRFTVLEAPQRGSMRVQLRRAPSEEAES